MKVFALATALMGSACADPAINSQMGSGFNSLNQLHRGGSNHMEQPSMKMSMEMKSSGRQMSNGHMSDWDMSDRQKSNMDKSQMSPMDLALRKMSPHLKPADRMSLAEQKMSRRNMYGHQMSRSQLAKQKMSMLDSRQMPSFDDERAQGKQFYKHTDQKGNYAYGYAYGNSEKFEEGNAETGIKGHYTFVDANGLSKRVDYIADKEGFRILNDDADNNRFKREVQPDLVRTRMSSYMDSSSLRQDQPDRQLSMVSRDNKMNLMRSDMMGQNMRKENMMGQNMRNENMMGQNMRNENLRGQDMYSNMMGRNMLRSKMYNNKIAQDMSSNMIGQDRSSSMMGQDAIRSNMYDNRMGQDMSSNMMGGNMMGKNMIKSNMMGQDGLRTNIYNNRMGQDMSSKMMDENMMKSSLMGQEMSSDMMGHNMMRSNMYGNEMGMSSNMNRMNAYSNGLDSTLLGQRSVMGQRMEMERIPDNRMVNQMF